MPLPELYENKVLQDEELPIQISINWKDTPTEIFSSHWHEHIELHYIIQGTADMYLGQQCYPVQQGDLVIANSSELHSGYCTSAPYTADVIIFDIADLSAELAKKNYIFRPMIREDDTIRQLFHRIFQETERQEAGYKQLCKALVTELLVYLSRRYVIQSLPERDSVKRKKNLERLNAVLCYIEQHYTDRITVGQLAAMACLSEDRFGHLFRESVGRPPLQYINEMRLHKAMNLLRTNQYTVTEVADAVGFQDYNHFGRQFYRHYGCTPNDARRGKERSKK